jgi:sialidase-1
MYQSLSIFLILLFPFLGWSQPSYNVYTSGEEGHKTYRIPAIVQLPNHTLLAFAEGRVKGSNDFGDINIVLKRSLNAGKKWSPIQTIVDYGNLQAGNAAPVIDLLDPRYPKGRLFLFYNTGNQSEWDIRKGKGQREVWYITSTDGGFTWSEAINITQQVKPNTNNWRTFANTPGHAFQIPEGKYKGRLMIPGNHSEGEGKADYSDYFSHVFYTDDHGDHFKVSESLPIPGSNEATATYISQDQILLNARNQKGDIKNRIIGVSKDGGDHWDSVYFDTQLPDPVCEGTLLTVGKHKGKMVLAFCNPANSKQRNHLTLRLSEDDGKSWSKSWMVDSANNNPSIDYTAYSDIIRFHKNTIGVLYEKNNYASIIFKPIKISKWYSH